MIAISYRRQDSSPVAGRLYDRLQAEFGKGSVFMDFDSIPYGVDFREHIKQTLQRAKVVVAIIGPEWTGGKAQAERRIDDPTDFVRLEVASALENGIPIIPVLINNTPMPEAKNLPPELEGLAFRNGLALDTGIDFHHHADRLIAGIHRVVDPPKEVSPPALPPAPPPAPMPPTASPKSSRLVPISIAALLIAIAAIAAWYFFGRTRQETIVRQEPTFAPSAPATPAIAASSPSIAPAPAIAASSPSIAPAPAESASPPAATNEAPREHIFTGKVGAKEAVFRLRFESGAHVVGTYTQGGTTYRLEGRHPKGRMLLDEYTGEKLTAHIELNLVTETATQVRWEGTMRNTPPDNRVLPVYFERSPMATSPSNSADSLPENSGTSADYAYQGTVGPYQGSFQLHFEPTGRVTGTYTLATNKNLVLRLEGRNPKGKLFLDEYTRDRLSARLELSLKDSPDEIRWEGTMYNTAPDNRVFPVSFARPRK